MSEGYIYVVSKNDCSKIGVTTDPFTRLYALRGVEGKECQPAALWKCNYDRIYKIEGEIKELFYNDAFNGREWFKVSSATLISAVIKTANDWNTKLIRTDWPNEPIKDPINIDEYYINKIKIRDWLLSTKVPIRQIALKAGISRGSIYRIKLGKMAAKTHTVNTLLSVMKEDQEKIQCDST